MNTEKEELERGYSSHVVLPTRTVDLVRQHIRIYSAGNTVPAVDGDSTSQEWIPGHLKRHLISEDLQFRLSWKQVVIVHTVSKR